METAPPPAAHLRAGKIIKDRRIDLDLGQADLKAAGGPSVKVLSELENGRRWGTIQPRTIRRLEKVLQLEDGTLSAILAPPAYPDFVGDDPGLRAIWDIPDLSEEEREIAIRSLTTYRDALAEQTPPGQEHSASA
ncbi:helix-turn-helix transcriptional regulator [Actinomadura sp. K4S16]|uniref:helix-turn-helix transcriptional regulator n=1 Tax=Actinomadura sp. K4S16 TaxID=1316147 RepID=UPI0011EE7BB2|nr:helix-turn-helix transcriptional regulator [Actinomadura sp. K4S16]